MFRHEPEAVLKDNDLRTRQRFRFSPEESREIKLQLSHDSSFLRELNVMDYSLLGKIISHSILFLYNQYLSYPCWLNLSIILSFVCSCCLQKNYSINSRGMKLLHFFFLDIYFLMIIYSIICRINNLEEIIPHANFQLHQEEFRL